MSGKSPPLSMRLRLRHWVAVDCLVAAGGGLILLAMLLRLLARAQPLASWWPAGHWLLAPLLAAGFSVPVAMRRLWPVPALTVTVAAGALELAVGAPVTTGPILPIMLVLYLVATACRRPVALAGLAAALGLLAAQGVISQLRGTGSGPAIGTGLMLIIVWLIGGSLRQRRAYAAHLRAQAAEAAVTDERLRIARELHDVVAHGMTVVAVQAGFGEYVFDSQPGQARAALGAIQAVTREALADMQRLLGVLREAGGTPAAPLAPAPGLGGLERLADSVTGAGVKVELRRTGQLRPLAPGIDLAAFRIVQEALTNVMKHSGAGRCEVTVGYGAGDLSIEITDPGPAAPAAAGGTGHGIAGMRERVSLCGGEFSAGPVPGGGFRVAARLPLAGASR